MYLGSRSSKLSSRGQPDHNEAPSTSSGGWYADLDHEWRFDAGNVFVRHSQGLVASVGFSHRLSYLPDNLDNVRLIENVNEPGLGNATRPMTKMIPDPNAGQKASAAERPESTASGVGLRLFASPSVIFSAFNATIQDRHTSEFDLRPIPVFFDMTLGFELALRFCYRYMAAVGFAPIVFRTAEYLVEDRLPSRPDEWFYHNWGFLSVVFTRASEVQFEGSDRPTRPKP